MENEKIENATCDKCKESFLEWDLKLFSDGELLSD